MIVGMHNMLKEYYKFLCRRLITWGRSVPISKGDRYVLNFESDEQVESFMRTLAQDQEMLPFQLSSTISNRKGLAFEIGPRDRKLVIVSTVDVTPDYLVNLRNRIGQQQGIWANTALLFVSNKVLDSINSGAKNIGRQGGPFNTDALRKNVNEEIQASQKLSPHDKNVLEYMVQAIYDGEQKLTLMDFADAYGIIEKGFLDNDDYVKMGYFQDRGLASYSSIEDRLKDNHTDFVNIRLLHGFGDIKARISKIVDGESLIRELSGENWESVDYKRVVDGKDRLKNNKKINLNYLAEKLTAVNPELQIWDRPKNQKKAGQRTRNIIIFNSDCQNNVTVRFPFDAALQNKYAKPARKTYQHLKSVETAKHELVLQFTDLSSDNPESVKVSYKHHNVGSLNFVFNILILPFDSHFMEDLRPYCGVQVKKEDQANLMIPDDMDSFTVGLGEQSDTLQVESISELNGLDVSNVNRVKIKFDQLVLSDESQDSFAITVNKVPVTFRLFDNDNKKIQPRSALSIEHYRREHEYDGQYADDKIIFGSKVDNTFKNQRTFFNLESEEVHTGKLTSEMENLELSEQLTTLYGQLLKALRQRNTLMSLVNWDEKITSLVKAILRQVKGEIDQTEGGVEVPKTVRNIARIGEYFHNGEIMYSPLNPMLLSYQLQVEMNIGSESLSQTIQRKLSPVHLVPFIKRNSINYRGYSSRNAPRWLCYSEATLAKSSDVTQAIVTERLKDFKKHFNYLFSISSNSVYNVKFVNVTDEKPVIKSLVDYLVSELKEKGQSIKGINPINVYMVNASHDANNSEFNEFYQLISSEDFTNFFMEPLKKIKDISDEEIIEMLKDKINVFYEYSANQHFHITFYQFKNKLMLQGADRNKLEINYSLDGIIGGTEYTRIQGSLKDGFGTKNLDEKNTAQTIDFAKSWNELLVATTQRHASMNHGMTLINSIEEVDSQAFQKQFDSSNWVTVLNPEVKLDYFNKLSGAIYVIHYTDYTNSANYESITLTEQVKQYTTILSENLPNNIKRRDDTDYINNIIKTFNIINGEWLLRLVSHRDQQLTVKEKLSILTVTKEMAGILKYDGVVWIPLSLEEILRVSGSFVGENRNDAVFSAKSLGEMGKISDDLLFMGLWKKEGKFRISFLPTEVKVGLNPSGVIDKAVQQVRHTAKVLNSTLAIAKNFKSKFYLDFFMKLYFANAEKLYTNGEMSQTEFDQLQDAKYQIIQGNLVLDNSILSKYQYKVVFSLKKDHINRQIRGNDDYTLIEVPEDDAYSFAGQETNKLVNEIQTNRFGFDKERLLSGCNGAPAVTNLDAMKRLDDENITESNHDDTESAEDKRVVSAKNVAEGESLDYSVKEDHESLGLDDGNGTAVPASQNTSIQVTDSAASSTGQTSMQTRPTIENKNQMNSENVTSQDKKDGPRLLLGTVDGSTDKMFWEYGNNQLSNRHMLITGKSGQGKTYFIQTLLLEFAKAKMDTLVVDYTDSYMSNQLDPILKDNVKNINQHIVLQKGLPINPFIAQQMDIDSYHQLEDVSVVAQRVAEVLDFVFNLGIQQKSQLITIMTSGMEKDPDYTFTTLKHDLLGSGESLDQKIYGRLQPLLMRDPFTYKENFDWANYFGTTGRINIIQLSGYPASIQNAMIEFLLWDLMNYAKINSDKKLIYPVFLDEVQNLNFDRDSPTFKILTEGRKFGFSGLFATQSLSSVKGEVDAIYNAAEQVHFLPPETQTKAIAKLLSSNRSDQAKIEQSLAVLRKGQCLISGPAQAGSGKLVKQLNVVNIDDLASRLD